MKIGIFGGAFNPPHIGHLLVADAVREQLHLDRVMFVPAADPPHRLDVRRRSGKDRLEMIRLAIQDNPGFEISDIELQRSGKSYTVDTVKTIAAMHSSDQLYLLMGSDNFSEFDSWKLPDEIIATCDLVVFPRPGFELAQVKHQFSKSAQLVSVPPIPISASDIRRRVKQGKSIRYWVPVNVEAFIQAHSLYKD